MFKFRNIDAFVPGRFERMGMLKGKRWYINNQNIEDDINNMVLFKPKRRAFGDKKVFCANHYGELIGYLLALGSRTQSCKVELAHLSKYYENKYKEKNHGTPIEKDGCIIYSHLEKNQILEHGRIVLENYIIRNYNTYKNTSNSIYNDIDTSIAAIESETREFYNNSNIQRSKDYIEAKVDENRKNAINMIIYDCLYGNNDRHDENWALVKDTEGRDINLYSLYDNERVLGLYENIRTIEDTLANNSIEKDSEKLFFSRMTIPGEKGKKSSYKDVLAYLISSYSETEELLDKHLKGNPPIKVRMYLESCENLPRPYINYGAKMYESRYNFAKDLIKKHKENGNKNNKKSFEEGSDALGNR